MSEKSVDVIVIGAGVAGCGVAWRLASRGMAVLLMERGDPGHGASWAAAGMLTPLAEPAHNTAFLALAEDALARWPAFTDELIIHDAGDPGWIRCGRLQIATSAAAADALRGRTGSAAGKRAHATWLDPAAARALEPCLPADLLGAAAFPDDAAVDPRALGHALLRAAVEAGARLRIAEAASISRDAQGVTGVILRDGTQLAARTVVLAAGAWAAQLEGLPAPLPVRPVRGEMLALRAPGITINHIIWGDACYIVPRMNGRLLVGATMDDVGFAPGPTPAGIAKLAQAAERVCPGIGRQQIAETWAGYRPGTPDDLPILGADPRLPGLVHASGLYRNGILLAPLVAAEIAAVASGEPTSCDLEPFSPIRTAVQ